MWMQVKAFALLIAILLIVDALAFHGYYRGEAGGRIAWFLGAVAPGHWHGLGQGRDWSAPKPPRRD
jgi:hypothetical protein